MTQIILDENSRVQEVLSSEEKLKGRWRKKGKKGKKVGKEGKEGISKGREGSGLRAVQLLVVDF